MTIPPPWNMPLPVWIGLNGRQLWKLNTPLSENIRYLGNYLPIFLPPIGHKLIFTRKIDAQRNTIRYKVRLVAQGFSQRLGSDFDQTYSLVLDITSFRLLLSFTVQLHLHIYLLDVVTAYLHGVLDTPLFFTHLLTFFPIYHHLNLVNTSASWFIKPYMALNKLAELGTTISVISWFLTSSPTTHSSLYFYKIYPWWFCYYWCLCWWPQYHWFFWPLPIHSTVAHPTFWHEITWPYHFLPRFTTPPSLWWQSVFTPACLYPKVIENISHGSCQFHPWSHNWS